MEEGSALNNFQRIFKLASYMKSVPFELCPGDGLRVKLNESRLKTILWQLGAVAVGFNTVIHMMRFGKGLLMHGLPCLQPVQLFYLIMTCFSALHTLTLANGSSEAVAWINNIQNMALKGSGIGNVKPYYASQWVRLSTLYLTLVTLLGMTVSLMAFNMMAPNDAMHLSAYLPDGYLGKWTLVISITLKAAECLWMSSQWTVMWIVWQGSVDTTILLSNAIGQVAKREGWNGLGRIAQLYRELQLLNVLHNAFNVPIFTWAALLFCLIIVTVFTYGSINFIGQVPVLMYAVFPFCAIFGLFMQTWFYLHVGQMEVASGLAISEMKKQSSSVPPLGIWRSAVEARKREVGALRPCVSRIGIIGNHNLVQTRFINEWTLSFLLSLKSY